jgi:hypothetical protein
MTDAVLAATVSVGHDPPTPICSDKMVGVRFPICCSRPSIMFSPTNPTLPSLGGRTVSDIQLFSRKLADMMALESMEKRVKGLRTIDITVPYRSH